MAKAKKISYIHTEPNDAKLAEAIATLVHPGNIVWNYLADIKMSDIEGSDLWERGMCEGKRRLADEMLNMALQGKLPEPSVKTNLEG